MWQGMEEQQRGFVLERKAPVASSDAAWRGRCRDAPKPICSVLQPWALAGFGDVSLSSEHYPPGSYVCRCSSSCPFAAPVGGGGLGVVWCGQASPAPSPCSWRLPSPCCFCKALLDFACDGSLIVLSIEMPEPGGTAVSFTLQRARCSPGSAGPFADHQAGAFAPILHSDGDDPGSSTLAEPGPSTSGLATGWSLPRPSRCLGDLPLLRRHGLPGCAGRRAVLAGGCRALWVE